MKNKFELKKSILEAWLKELRSGNNSQGSYRLMQVDKDMSEEDHLRYEFCCIGLCANKILKASYPALKNLNHLPPFIKSLNQSPLNDWYLDKKYQNDIEAFNEFLKTTVIYKNSPGFEFREIQEKICTEALAIARYNGNTNTGNMDYLTMVNEDFKIENLLAIFNDYLGLSFKDIADWLELNVNPV